ncbi:hypothetical protein RYH80_12535 [Halobaculum sp. MBLA0147]|uniref:hypothetical protein n=1 Tax=Halobaculum sp. MBLA0147 TaxID=3079934 RepID=UPI003523B212
MVRLRRRRDHGLHAVEQVPTLRDRLVGLPVEPAIPDHWELGCKVVKFKDELPADAITLQRPRRAQELILTTAGTDDRKTLGIYEHDRTRGRRTRLSTVEHEETRALKATLYEAFTDTCRHAARIDGLPPSVAAIDARDPAVVVENERVRDEGDDSVVERVLTKISFY